MRKENGRLENETTAVNCQADSSSVGASTDKAEQGGFLTPEDRQMLEAAGIPHDFALGLGVRSVSAAGELPDNLQIHADALPGTLFPWLMPGGAHYQLRPVLPVDRDGKTRKYLQAPGVQLVNVLRGSAPLTRVYIVEGTKQALAARAWAPPDVLVIGIAGCHNAMKGGALLAVIADLVEDLPVTVFFDADLTTNDKVLLAAHRLEQALVLEGATSVAFVLLPTDGKSKAGLDDLLGQRLPDKREKFLERLAKKAVAALPRRVIEQVDSRDNDPRPQLSVAMDRLHLIQETVTVMVGRWDGWRLFDHGGVITELKGDRTTPLDRGQLLGVLAESAYFYRPTQGGPKPAWPDANVVLAVAAGASQFTGLDRVSRAPFVRSDGTICQTPGYDAPSRTFLVEDESLRDIVVPDDPTRAEVQAAVNLILDEWFGDMPLHEAADRANLLALVLTPFIRGLVPLVPLAVIDGLMMGVGKNLMADCIALVCTGADADPLPFPNDDDELRKVITSTFGTGAELFVFDEAHSLHGRSLARALTATSYTDRILGVSRMARYPNTVTWMALGNQVQVYGDLARRVYRIAIRPSRANPERRTADEFRHADLRAWTRENRPALVQAALTLVRAWYAAGQPRAPRAVSFGSFESWERIVGGIVHHAGVADFLGNLSSWRGEADFETAYWADHLHDLWVQFGEDKFTVHEVVDAMKSGEVTELPPDMYSYNAIGYSRDLGQAYAKVKDRWYGNKRLVVAGRPGAGGARGRVNTWRIEESSDGPPTGDSQGSEGWEGSPYTLSRPAGVLPPLAPAPEPAQVRTEEADLCPSHPSGPSRAALAVAFMRAEAGRLGQLAAWMSQTGLRVDTDLLQERLPLQIETSRRLREELVRRLRLPTAAAASPRPWATNAGLAALEQLVSPTWPRRADGRPQVNKELVAEASARGGLLGDVCSLIYELLEVSPFPAALEKHRHGDRVHPQYSMQTHTGRWASTQPNILGVGQRTAHLLEDRDLILAEPGEVLVGVDLAGIDARCVLGLSGDPGYADLFQPGVDIHSEMSELFFGDRDHRQQAKAITHGIPYGRGARTIAHHTDMSVAEVESMIAAYFRRYPEVRQWQDDLRQRAVQGQPLPTGTGRSVSGDADRPYTTAPARAAQACARDLAAVGLLRVVDAGLQNHMRLFLHDELVLSVPIYEAAVITAQVVELMSFEWLSPSGLVVPVVAQPASGAGPRWSDLYAPKMVAA